VNERAKYVPWKDRTPYISVTFDVLSIIVFDSVSGACRVVQIREGELSKVGQL